MSNTAHNMLVLNPYFQPMISTFVVGDTKSHRSLMHQPFPNIVRNFTKQSSDSSNSHQKEATRSKLIRIVKKRIYGFVQQLSQMIHFGISLNLSLVKSM